MHQNLRGHQHRVAHHDRRDHALLTGELPAADAPDHRQQRRHAEPHVKSLKKSLDIVAEFPERERQKAALPRNLQRLQRRFRRRLRSGCRGRYSGRRSRQWRIQPQFHLLPQRGIARVGHRIPDHFPVDQQRRQHQRQRQHRRRQRPPREGARRDLPYSDRAPDQKQHHHQIRARSHADRGTQRQQAVNGRPPRVAAEHHQSQRDQRDREGFQVVPQPLAGDLLQFGADHIEEGPDPGDPFIPDQPEQRIERKHAKREDQHRRQPAPRKPGYAEQPAETPRQRLVQHRDARMERIIPLPGGERLRHRRVTGRHIRRRKNVDCGQTEAERQRQQKKCNTLMTGHPAVRRGQFSPQSRYRHSPFPSPSRKPAFLFSVSSVFTRTYYILSSRKIQQ